MLKRLLLPALFLLLAVSSFAQDSLNLSLLGRWDKDSLPVYSGISYNEVFGWVDPADDREYAILGTLDYTYFIEVTNPAVPVVRDSVRGRGITSIWRDFKTFGKYAYGVADAGTSSLQIFDLSYLPDSVKKVYDDNTVFERAHNVFIDTATGHMYVSGANTRGDGMIVYDLNINPENPPVVFNGSTGAYVHDCFVRNDTAYLNSGFSGLRIFDFTTPSSPVLIGTLPTYPAAGYNHSSWMVPGTDNLVMADETHGMALKNVDVSDPSSPTVVSLMKSMLLAPADTNSIPHNPVCAGVYAAISYYHDGVVIFDVRNPAAPILKAYYDTWSNVDYGGYAGVWGVYPFLPSGNILGSDVNNGLYILRPDFPFPTDVAGTLTPADVTCAGAGDGTATAAGSGGTGPYSYDWSTGDTTATVSGLAPGVYTVTITDRYGWPYVDSVTIAEPSALVAGGSTTPSGCGGVFDGTATASPSGGTPGYTYLWSTGDTTSGITALSPATYFVTVTDAYGCNTIDTLVVGGVLTVSVGAGADTLFCEGLVNLSALDPSPGMGTWSVLSGAGFFSPPNSPTASVFAMAPGLNTYLWTVTQGACTWRDTIVVDVAMTAFTDAGDDDTLCGTTTYTLSANDPTPAGGTWTYSGFSLSSSTDPYAVATGLTHGTHTLTWTTTDGSCTVSDDVVLHVFFDPTSAFSASPTGMTVAFTEGANYETTYDWDFGDGGTSAGPNPSHTYASNGTYTVCLTVTNPCGSATHCEPVLVGPVLNEDAVEAGIVVYPNPSSGVFQISSVTDQLIRWQCWSTSGQALAEGEWHSASDAIDLSALPVGLYLLRLETAERVVNVPVSVVR
jgi:choice-of-anchor B domain-containing protein